MTASMAEKKPFDSSVWRPANFLSLFYL